MISLLACRPFIKKVMTNLKLLVYDYGIGPDKIPMKFGDLDVIRILNDMLTQPPPGEQEPEKTMFEFITTVHDDSLGVYYGQSLIDHINHELSRYRTAITYVNSLEECEMMEWCGNYFLYHTKVFIAFTGIE